MTEEEKKEVRRIRRKARYEANREEELAAAKLWKINNPEQHRETRKKYETVKNKWYTDLKETLSCEHCGENHTACIDFHHKDPHDKEIAVSDALRMRWPEEKVRAEIAKCMVLCANCHRKLHYNLRLGIPKSKSKEEKFKEKQLELSL